MLPLALESTDSLVADLPWEVVGVVLVAVLCGLAWSLLTEVKRAQQRLERLDRLEDLRGQVARLVDSSGGLDLRRLEHVLIDMRDMQKRLEERLLALAESARGDGVESTPAERSGPHLSERAVGRLLAMGYERVRVLSKPEDVAGLTGRDGEILVEARRDGAVAKGRVLVRDGAIADVAMRSAHSMFP